MDRHAIGADVDAIDQLPHEGLPGRRVLAIESPGEQLAVLQDGGVAAGLGRCRGEHGLVARELGAVLLLGGD